MQKYTILFFLSLSGIPVAAQSVSVGVEGGVPIADRVFPPDESRPYIVGPSVEFRLPARFALEAEALYQRVGTSEQFSFISGIDGNLTLLRKRADVWQFPLLGKYYFQPRSARGQPYIETGWAFRTALVHTSGTQTATGSAPVLIKNDNRSPLNVGASFGAGIRYNVGRMAISPELRYTRWSQDSLIRQNELGFLLGIHF